MRNFNDGAKLKFHYWFVIAMLSLFGPSLYRLVIRPHPSHPIPISIISGGGTRKAISRCLPNVDVSHRISGHSSNIVGGRARGQEAPSQRPYFKVVGRSSIGVSDIFIFLNVDKRVGKEVSSLVRGSFVFCFHISYANKIRVSIMCYCAGAGLLAASLYCQP